MHYGIDVGGTKIEIAIYDPDWQCLDRWREPTPADDGEALMALLAGLVREADRRHGGRGSLGLGFPGVLDEQGHLVSANLPGLRPFVLETALATHLDRDFIIEIDHRLSRVKTKEEFIECVMHEMVHVWQGATGRIKDTFRGPYKKLWKCKDGKYRNYLKTAYMKQPWEVQAYKMQGPLTDAFIDEISA